MLYQKLKEYREINNLTQEDLANKLNVSRSAVAKWEQQKGLPSKASLNDISNLLNININDLLEEDEPVKVIDNIVVISNKKRNKLIIIFSSIIFFLVIYLSVFSLINKINIFILFNNNKLNSELIDEIISPDGKIYLKVYNEYEGKTLTNKGSLKGYRIEVSGDYSGISYNSGSIYKGVYFSCDSRFYIEEFISINLDKNWLEIIDFKTNGSTNLMLYLSHGIANHYNLEYDMTYEKATFEFLEWSSEVNSALIKYQVNDINRTINGYCWWTPYSFEVQGIKEF